MPKQLNTEQFPIGLQAEAALPLVKALGLATVRRIRRLHKVHCELAELQTAVVTPEELVLLEDHGFMVDFETGMAIDVSGEASA